MSFSTLLTSIRACSYCAKDLPCEPRPIVQADPSARLCIVGQAPGKKVHETGIPWNDRSGTLLREWIGLDERVFYDPLRVAIVPVGFCYPGRGKNGDNPPRPACARRWHPRLNALMSNIKLTLLVGRYAHEYYLGDACGSSVSATIMARKKHVAQGYFPLPHPSPRNRAWLKSNAWFEEELVPELKLVIASLGL